MHKLQTLEHLVNDVLLMDILKDVCSYHSMKIGVHEIEHQIDVTVVLSSDHILEADDVFVTRQLLQENNFSECSLRISCILKCIKILLESHDILGLFVDGFPHDTIGSLSYKQTVIYGVCDSLPSF